MTKTIIICAVIVLFIFTYLVVSAMLGSGGFKRMVTLTGVYAVCRPGGYDAVCFLDADSNQGGLSCLPLSEITAAGKCL